MNIKRALVLALALLIATPVFAGPFDPAMFCRNEADDDFNIMTMAQGTSTIHTLYGNFPDVPCAAKSYALSSDFTVVPEAGNYNTISVNESKLDASAIGGIYALFNNYVTSGQLTPLQDDLATIDALLIEIGANLNGTSTSMTVDETANNGLLKKSDKVKLDSLNPQIQSDWSQSSTSATDYIKNKPSIPTMVTRSVATATRSLNSCFQVSSTTDALVTYSVDIATTLSLAGGQTGTVFLEYSDNSGCSTNTKEISRSVNGNTGTLTVGLNITQNVTGTLSGFVPAGKWVQLRTVNTTGSPTFTYRSQQEVKF